MPAKSSPRKSTRRRKAIAASALPPTSPEAFAMEDVEEMQNMHEPLRKKYMRYVIERHEGPPMLAHPFCRQLAFDLDRCALIHREIDELSAMAAEFLQQGQWEDFIVCHTPPHRIAAFRKLLRTHAAKLSDEEYWRNLRMIYEEAANPSAHWVTFRQLFRSRRKKREHLMNPRERDMLRRLPDSLTVYRGYARFGGEGMSWTLDRRVADWFAHRDSGRGEPRVITGEVRRDDVLALITTTNEAELLVPDGSVTQQVHGPAVEDDPKCSAAEYMQPPFDIEALCVQPASPRQARRYPARRRGASARAKPRPR